MGKPKYTTAELQAELATIQSSVADYTLLRDKLTGATPESIIAQQPTIDTYLKSSGEAKLSDVTASNYTDVYNATYNKIKDVRFTVEKSMENAAAFYVYDPATEAKKTTEKKLEAETKAKEAYLAQQDRLKQYVEGVQNTSQQKAFNSYLQSVLEKDYSYLQQGYIRSDSPLFDRAAFNKASNRNKDTKVIYVTDARGRRTAQTVFMYKDEAASKRQLDTVTSMYLEKFNADTGLQKTWVNKYINDTNDRINKITKELNKRNRN